MNRAEFFLKILLKNYKERKGEGKEIDFENLQRKGRKLHTKLPIVATSISGIGESEFHSYFLYFCSI